MSERPSQTVGVKARSSVSLRARQHLAPTAIQGLEVLALPVARLDAYVRDLVERNPLLELDYARGDLSFEQFPEECPEVSDDLDTPTDDFGACAPSAVAWGAQGFDLARLRDECSQTETLHSHLRMQLASARIDEDDRELMDALIENIDDNGYFAGSMAAVCAETSRSVEDGLRLLSRVQQLSPRGVGARDLAECLMLQLDDDVAYAEVIRDILRSGLEDLAENRTTKLMRTYHLTIDDLSALREAICSLNPRPGASFSQRKGTVYVIPDLAIRRDGVGFSVRVTGELSETLVLNGAYDRLIRQGALDRDTLEWVCEKRAEADAALANIDQRKKTLHRFGVYLVEAQYDFFVGGDARMRPLTMQQAADALGVHVSTISRTVQDKRVLTPWGVYPLKHFFSSSLACSAEERRHALSSLAIKDRIKDLVAHEDRRTPLSDASITAILNGEGVDIKRRTVAKYREALGIGRQSQRRR
ncbi:RNA polymerase sigma-54 factor [Gordonibacter sp. An230]|uniref:RNA polymerase factor sigma-54 n=1 Tax=Gordonibacter sp. An230 TaxID=1965592 RepID=UPI000B385B29|nr:RNA polymerase factor sigma-54 [Gordonibacter sp. An230]OUO89767.1 RNA polymerase sigma-54 factor [Gordonibacter sp. An230]